MAPASTSVAMGPTTRLREAPSSQHAPRAKDPPPRPLQSGSSAVPLFAGSGDGPSAPGGCYPLPAAGAQGESNGGRGCCYISRPAAAAQGSGSGRCQPPPPPLLAGFAEQSVHVTVRFRPLSPREMEQNEKKIWYAEGDRVVRCRDKPQFTFAYDHVFSPEAATSAVYDVSAKHVVVGALEGTHGTILAYGVTSSGKTYTLHGDERSQGLIELAVKDVFGHANKTQNREFVMHLSYLEIYNEEVHDLLNPTGKNLQVKAASQGRLVKGLKEEVVLSAEHTMSLIAAGEEHRHVGSTKSNRHSSRSHSIFILTIESSSCDSHEVKAINFSRLMIVDLAGSESSNVETTGIQRTEGSYINRSLFTLGTVISKLCDGKSAHVPFRDSKLTFLLQPSLSGAGYVSLICTVSQGMSTSDQTHNTLKFGHNAKRIKIRISQNNITDDTFLIKKYQAEIRRLKEENEKLKNSSTDGLEEDKKEPYELIKQLKDKTNECLRMKEEICHLRQLLAQAEAPDHRAEASHQAGTSTQVKGNAEYGERNGRRKYRKWSHLEEEALRKGIDKHGAGNWKLILMSDQSGFVGRTAIDLKDKWRNMKTRAAMEEPHATQQLQESPRGNTDKT